MMTDSGVRQLKAIMFTDIKGFSAMMGQDEERTIRLVREHRQIVRDILPRHSGREHETIGDAFVVLFDSALNAVQCAAEIQRELRQRNAELPAEEQVWIRIGIHLGDIVLQDGDIYGDGVNIAARVEPQAEPGGICITQDVYVQVQKKVALRAICIGKKELKNITDAPELYRILLEGDAVPDGEVLAGAGGKAAWPKAPLWKTILWFALTMPWALFLLLGPFMADNWHEGILTSFGIPPDSPRALSIALSLVLGAGMVIAIFAAAKYWRRGVASSWIQGPRFLVFPVLGLLLLAFHFLSLRGQVASFMTAFHSYSAITAEHADRTTALIKDSVSSYLNAVVMNQTPISLLSWAALVSALFVPGRRPRARGWWRAWLLLPGVLVAWVAAATQPAVAAALLGGGLWGAFVLLAGLLTAGAILRTREARTGALWPAWQGLRAGVLTCLAFSCAGTAVGYLQAFVHLDEAHLEVRRAALALGTSVATNGTICCGVGLAALLLALVVIRRRSLSFGKPERAAWRDWWWSVATVAVAVVPLFAGKAAGGIIEDLYLPQLLVEMHPTASGGDAGPSCYLDKRPQGLAFYRDLDAKMTGTSWEDSSRDKALAALAGGKECADALTSSMKRMAEASPARCITAIEARLYCESIGLRLPTPEEWDTALGQVPVDPPANYDKPFGRGPFAEWTMRLVHGNPEFEIRGAAEVPGAPSDLKPSAFSDKVGFRCAFSFEE